MDYIILAKSNLLVKRTLPPIITVGGNVLFLIIKLKISTFHRAGGMFAEQFKSALLIF